MIKLPINNLQMKQIIAQWLNRYFSEPEAIVLVVLLIAAMLLLQLMSEILIPIIVSIVIAYLLFHIVKWLQKWHCPALVATILTFSLFLAFLILFFTLVLPVFWTQLSALLLEIPAALQYSSQLLLQLQRQFAEFLPVDSMQQPLGAITAYFAGFSKEFLAFSLASISNLISIIVYLILVPLLVFFFLLDGPAIKNWLLTFLPAKRPFLQKISLEAHYLMGKYLYGKAIELLIVALLSIFAFLCFKLRYAVILGLLAGLSVMIPYVGVALFTICLLLAGLIQWGWSQQLLYLMLIHAVISIIDGNILVPLLFAGVMRLHPIAIILSVLIFGNLFGFWGIFFSIPLISILNSLRLLWPKKLK